MSFISVDNLNCKKIRKLLILSLYKAGSGHPGSSLSIIEILYYIYRYEKNFKLILSKGHGVPAQYAVMNFFKIISKRELLRLRQIKSKTQGHPDRSAFPLIDASTGALGQGLSISIGYAKSKGILKQKGYVFCILGDGELQEGQIWEAAMYLESHYLDKLIIIVDYNKFQNDDLISKTLPIKNLKKKWESFGFKVFNINGHNIKQIKSTIRKIKKLSKPSIILANTIKGKGIPFMENVGKWHSLKINEKSFSNAMKELG